MTETDTPAPKSNALLTLMMGLLAAIIVVAVALGIATQQSGAAEERNTDNNIVDPGTDDGSDDQVSNWFF